MTDHSARDHSTWSASATARNWQCPGALSLSQGVAESTNEAADWGTACHQIAEKCLRQGKDASDFIGTTEKGKKHSFKVDDEMASTAQEYVDYCRSLMTDGARYWIEEKLSLADLNPPFDAGGTGDFVAYKPRLKEIEIVDLKGGRGIVVEVEGNPQGRSYGLGTVLKHAGLDIERVKVTIVQPRAPHKDGVIRSETFHVADLAEWTADLLAAMKRSKQAMDEHAAAGSNQVLLDEWRDKWLKPGKCTFCPAEGFCPALRRDAMSVAAVWFDDFDQPRVGNSALETSPEAVARDLDMIPMLEDWIKARRALAHQMAEQGVKLPTPDGAEYFLVDKIGNRKWADDDEWRVAVAVMAATGLTEEQVYARELKSVAQIEKVVGAKNKSKIESLWHKPITGTNLVRSDKTTREPAKSTAERYFEAT